MRHRDQIERLAAKRTAALRAERDRLQADLVRHAIGGVLLVAGMALLLAVTLLVGANP